MLKCLGGSIRNLTKGLICSSNGNGDRHGYPFQEDQPMYVQSKDSVYTTEEETEEFEIATESVASNSAETINTNTTTARKTFRFTRADLPICYCSKS